MKVIYFTFLFLFLSFKISAVENCLSLCPKQDLGPGGCFSSCLERNRAAVSTPSAPPSQYRSAPSAKSKANVSTAKKSSTSKKSADESPSEDKANENTPGSSPASSASCGDTEYPSIGGCQPCGGLMNKVVAGKVYCASSESQNEQSEQEEPSFVCAYINKGVWKPNKNECLTKESCESKGGTWDPDARDCEEKSAATSSTDSNQCKQRFEQMKDKCIDEASSAMTSCNDNNEEMQVAENTAKLIGAGSVTSMQVACSKIGELSKFANGALVGWKAICSTNQGGCTESCNQAKEILFSGCIEKTTQEALIAEHYNTITGNINQCESYKQKIAQATQHAAAALAQLKASEQCKKDTSSLVNNAVDQCKANPNSPLCTDLQKCSDATFASQNAVCACVSNPTSPACLQASANYGGGASSTGATLPGVSGGKNGSGLPGLAGNSNDGSGSNSGAGSAGSPASDGHGVGGRQGDASSAGNLKNGAGGGAAGSGNHYAGGASKDPLKVNSGTLGGAAGGPGYFGRTPTATGAYGTNAINGNKGTLAKFDPRKYITGLGGQREYINLANQNIFMIVKMRYEDKKTSLLPENFNLKK